MNYKYREDACCGTCKKSKPVGPYFMECPESVTFVGPNDNACDLYEGPADEINDKGKK